MTELRCAEVEARFVDAVDARLDPAESVRFHSHIEGCPNCRERAALWRGLVPALRETAPPAPDAMATRRMQLEIERQLAAGTAAAAPRRGPVWWVPALGLCAAAALMVVWWRTNQTPAPLTSPSQRLLNDASIGYAALTSVGGTVTIGAGASVTVGAMARVPVGAAIVVGTDSAAQLAMARGTTVRVSGPARVQLDGSADDVAIRLTTGRLDAEVAHRAAGERFAVITGDVRVVVRGTKFSVSAAGGNSHVEVTEGQVAVERAGPTGLPPTLISAGESFDSGTAGPDTRALQAAGDRPIDCMATARSCRATARAVRASMRAGDAERASRMIADARRGRGGVDERCDGDAHACDDELRYLNAEALNQSGHLDEAVAAYHGLDRRGAPSAMRQNALFAAGQIEKRRGHLAEAGTDFERAVAAAPRGALYEEALVGAMESARGSGDIKRARTFARRYLAEFPRGLGTPAAESIVDTRP